MQWSGQGCRYAGKGLLHELGIVLTTSPKAIDGNVDIARHIRNFDFKTPHIREALENVQYGRPMILPLTK